MRNLKKLMIFIMILVMTMVQVVGVTKNNVYAIPNVNKGTPVKIGVFFDNSNAMFISILKQNLERIGKENEKEVEFTFFDAKDNQSVQNESIEKALKEDFDLFIISIITPNLKNVEGTLIKIQRKNIPIILNPDPAEDIIKFFSYYPKLVVIGADYEQSGTIQGKILVNEWNSNKKLLDKNRDNILQYVMLKGRIGSPLTSLRTKHCILALREAGIKTEEIASYNCEWLQDCAENSIESVFFKYGNKIEAIISNNDSMAIGAVEALQKYGYNKGNIESTIPVVGIDGMPAAKDLIEKGFMAGTVAVEPKDLAEALYSIGMNLASGKSALENTNYKFDDTGFTVHLTYKEFIK
ncbi:galactose ABC transporter substrate-binding protein [Clostridium vincentii]|uniref:D-galactose/methyl-galactoside binding periplasmic protein MglB n=1 Tax=Clostridium vincentii TaxID=52704 RepID=A0A2T0B5P7_9CLOT|nr:galactose ABC transporter substrate-binding protein [Clostridium vincentii]PRR79209.1 D-galactose-binding periplasmic protein precursor [Clostridium vincentii]